MIIQLKIYHCDGAVYWGWAFCHKGWAFCHFCAKFIKSFYFYDIYFMTKIYVYQEFDLCLVMDQFSVAIKI